MNLIDKRKNWRENSAMRDKLDNGLPKLNDEKFMKMCVNVGNPFSQNQNYQKKQDF